MEITSTMWAGLDWGQLPQQLIFGLGIGAIYALIALGYTMVYGVLRLINFAHGEVFMLGAYTALFTSWWFGFRPEDLLKTPQQGTILILLIMILASMVFCALIGVIIERFAYRPMRNQPRIASLITAIGVSLLLQYGGALILPNSPPPAISSKVSPFADQITLQIRPPDAALAQAAEEKKKEFEVANTAFEKQLASEKSRFDLSPAGKELRDARLEAERENKKAQDAALASGYKLIVPSGQLIMLLTTVILMTMLYFLVMKTKTGRAMRAVSHDFDSAGLMGINVNSIVTITFVIGSALAGAGAMMNATFVGTPLTTFYGVQLGVKAFVAAVLGGIGNIPGAVLGGILMGVAETLVVWAGYSQYKDAIAFLILILVLLVRPGGLLGSAKVEKV
ncbi:MAG TPA: branched-chain amino acid ABC transporter permease [Fimbriimonadaceae bacterium]|nr:branched-chain amino acid ABC transporter permease [Fimbriimonadaceae bacterium]HRJ32211.1 branched-chain amino acid ABC transporter permease [Fimbriimonadaceae bacterium]